MWFGDNAGSEQTDRPQIRRAENDENGSTKRCNKVYARWLKKLQTESQRQRTKKVDLLLLAGTPFSVLFPTNYPVHRLLCFLWKSLEDDEEELMKRETVWTDKDERSLEGMMNNVSPNPFCSMTTVR